MGKISLQHSFPQPHELSVSQTAATCLVTGGTSTLSGSKSPGSGLVVLERINKDATHHLENTLQQKYPRSPRSAVISKMPFVPAEDVAKRTGTDGQPLCWY